MRYPELMYCLAYIVTLLLCYTSSKVYYITPSQDIMCPKQPCFTLNEFTDNIIGNISVDNATVKFLPGNHTLVNRLTVSVHVAKRILFISEHKHLYAWIICSSNANFIFMNLIHVQIKHLAFLGCGTNKVEFVSSFMAINCTFHGHNDGRTALVLNGTVANITSCLFISNGVSIHSYTSDDSPWNGGAIFLSNSVSWISECLFTRNEVGGNIIFAECQSNISVKHCNFMKNEQHNNNMLALVGFSNLSIEFSNFTDNTIHSLNMTEGLLLTINGTVRLSHCIFRYTYGTIIISYQSNITDAGNMYINNTINATYYVVMSSVVLCGCLFVDNIVNYFVVNSMNSFLSISNCEWTCNYLPYDDTLIYSIGDKIIIKNTVFKNITNGDILMANGSNIEISNSTFIHNSAKYELFDLFQTKLNINTTTIASNCGQKRGIFFAIESTIKAHEQLNFTGNQGSKQILFFIRCEANFTSGLTFSDNDGQVFVLTSHVIFKGLTVFEHNEFPRSTFSSGVITSIKSMISFQEETYFIENHSKLFGGAILAIGSQLHMYGRVFISDNSAEKSGGSVYLYLTELTCHGNCTFINNRANEYGGAIYAIASMVIVTKELHSDLEWSYLNFSGNYAKFGGALYLEQNSKLYGLDDYLYQYKILFERNSACQGGAIYVNDHSNSGTCSRISYSIQTECFFQTLYTDEKKTPEYQRHSILFLHNFATVDESVLYGGLLDRCTVNPFAKIHINESYTDVSGVSGLTYLKAVSNFDDLDLISSEPVRVCFCTNMNPDCGSVHPIILVRKGEAFTITVVAVDQVSHPIHAIIHSSLSSPEGSVGEGEQSYKISNACKKLTFHAYSSQDSEQLILYAEGPCKDSGKSKQHLSITFTNCSCPIGFWPLNSTTSCKCDCDPKLQNSIRSCDLSTASIQRKNRIWLNYINSTFNNHQHDFLIYPNCPYDYCYPPADDERINFNIPNGADAQCDHHRSGLLCGSCKMGFSLSLASSECVQCPGIWPGLLFTILYVLFTVLLGIAIIAILLATKMTVAIGTLNGIIFYANVVATYSSTIMPFTTPNLFTIFIKMLNFQWVYDTCFYNGMDTYAITWFGIMFSAYLFTIVISCILISECSSKFAKLIGKGNPVAALATLILFSYAKLSISTIHILSFAVLKYPDGSYKVVWRPDASVDYFKGKHIPLFLTAIVIVIISLAYTILLFSWQWLLRAPNEKGFQWIRNTKLNCFMDAYFAPFKPKYRYWTGLLLFARILLFITSAANVSGNPHNNLMVIGIISAAILLLKASLGNRLYKNNVIDCFESVCYFNVLFLTLATYYSLGYPKYQKAAASISCTIALAMFLSVLIYHILWYPRCCKRLRNCMIRKVVGIKVSNHRTTIDCTEAEFSSCAPTSSVIDGMPNHRGGSEQDADVRQATTEANAQAPALRHVINQIPRKGNTYGQQTSIFSKSYINSTGLREPLLQEHSS